MRNNIRLIALDLDGTLLNKEKQLSDANCTALRRAAEAGIEIVPTTGRFYDAMPEAIRKLPFIHYVISINGAQVYNLQKKEIVYRAEIPWRQGIEIMSWLDMLPAVYDCYQDNAAWMTGKLKEKIDEIIVDPHYRKMFHELRQSVPELKALLAERKHDVQKIQFFVKNPELHARLMRELDGKFSHTVILSSVAANVEINHEDANKGRALRELAAYLRIPMKTTMSFGDGLNDASMIWEAGFGIVMENGHPDVKKLADAIAPDCDTDGVATAIYRYCLKGS